MTISCPILSQDFKNVIYFYSKKCQKLHFKKWRHHIYLVFDLCTAKSKQIKILLWNLVCVFSASSLMTYIRVFWNHQFHMHLFLKNRNFEFGAKIHHKSNIADLWSLQFYVFWRFRIALCSKTVHSSSLQTLTAFWSKIAENGLNKTRLSQ